MDFLHFSMNLFLTGNRRSNFAHKSFYFQALKIPLYSKLENITAPNFYYKIKHFLPILFQNW